MYQHVIVPFDGVLEHRAVLAPAGDLAWRWGAKVVVVATNESHDDDVRAVLKTQAMSRSGADADFWVDLGVDIGDALLAAAANRDDPVICVATRHRRGGVLRRRPGTTSLPAIVLQRAECPVLVVGPEADTSRGLPITTLYVSLSEEAGGERAAELAVAWAQELRVDVRLLVALAPDAVDTEPPADAVAVFDRVRRAAPSSRMEVIQTERPAAALAAIAGEDPDGLVVLGRTGGDGREPLGGFAAEVVATCARAVLFAPPAG